MCYTDAMPGLFTLWSTHFLSLRLFFTFPSTPISRLVILENRLALMNIVPEGLCLLTVSLVHTFFHPLFLSVSFFSRLLPHSPHKAQARLSQAGRRPALNGLWLLLFVLGLYRQVYSRRLLFLSLSHSHWQYRRFHHAFLCMGLVKTICRTAVCFF